MIGASNPQHGSIISLRIPQIDLKSERETDAKILCYVYLKQKICDVRSISEDETLIKLSGSDDLQTMHLTLQVKKQPNDIIGYVKLPVQTLINFQENPYKQWFALHKNKEAALRNAEIQYDDKLPRVLLEIEVMEDKPSEGYLDQDKEKTLKLVERNDVKQEYQQTDDEELTYSEREDTYSLSKISSALRMGETNQYRIGSDRITQEGEATGTINLVSSSGSQYYQSPLVTQEVKVEELKDSDIPQLLDNLQAHINQKLSYLSQVAMKFKQLIQNPVYQDHPQKQQQQQLLSSLHKDTQSLITHKQTLSTIKQQLQKSIEKLDKTKISESQQHLDQLTYENQLKLSELNINQNNQSSPVKRLKDQEQSGKRQEILELLASIKNDLKLQTLTDKVKDTLQCKYQVYFTKIASTHKSQLVDLINKSKTAVNEETEIKRHLEKEQDITQSKQNIIDSKNLLIARMEVQLSHCSQETTQLKGQYAQLVQVIRDNNSTSRSHNQMLNQQIETLKQKKEQLLNKLKQVNSEGEILQTDRSNDSMVATSIQVQTQIEALDSEIEEFNTQVLVIKKQHQQVEQLQFRLKTEMTEKDCKIEEIDVGEFEAQNQILVQKQVKVLQCEMEVTKMNTEIDAALNRQDINRHFKETLTTLTLQMERLKEEAAIQQDIEVDLLKQSEESAEKLAIQDQDFRELALQQAQLESKIKYQVNDVAQIQSQMNEIPTQSILEQKLSMKKAEAKDLEQIIKARESEIDTLQLIQSQKEMMILDLQSQMGEQVPKPSQLKEVHFQLTQPSVDDILADYLKRHSVRVQFFKVDENLYQFGTKRITLRLDRDHNLVVKNGSIEHVTLSKFIIENEGIELQKQGAKVI